MSVDRRSLDRMTDAKTIAEILADERRPRGSWHHPIDPTPDEIAAACAKIQAGWTPEERHLRRRGFTAKPFEGGREAEVKAREAVAKRLERQRAG